MLPKRQRLPIQFFPRQAKTIFRGRHLTIRSIPNNLSYNRFGVIVGRNQVKLSTQRNLLRRMIFNFLKTNQGDKKIKRGPGRDYLILINSPTNEINKKELTKELQNNELSF